jgi:uncharacterized membrane protein
MSGYGPNLDVGHLLGKGWETFKLNPGLCIGMWFIYSLFNGSGGGGGGGGGGGSGGVDETVMLITAVVVGCFACLSAIIGPPLRGGFQLAFARLARGDESVDFGDLFAGFSKFLNLFLLSLLMFVIVVFGFILCIVPGVMAFLGLWPAYLLVMEDDLGPVEALQAAWALTDGYKGSLFVYAICAGLLQIVGLLACCVGLFVTGPVAELGWMTAYNELRANRLDLQTS